MLTGVREEEVGEAVTDEADTLEVGDEMPDSAREITLASEDLSRCNVVVSFCAPWKYKNVCTNSTDSASLEVDFLTLPGSADMIFA